MYGLPSRASDAGPDAFKRYDRDEDGFPCPDDTPNDGDPRCQSCDALVTELLPCPWDPTLQVGICCAEENEPDCECHQTDVDLFDATGCEFHDQSSPWNVRRRAITSAQEYEASKREVA